jgi:hypothetical protein
MKYQNSHTLSSFVSKDDFEIAVREYIDEHLKEKYLSEATSTKTGWTLMESQFSVICDHIKNLQNNNKRITVKAVAEDMMYNIKQHIINTKEGEL